MTYINIFAYGSLLWNKEKTTKNLRKATLHGWHRDYNLLSSINRGTPENKGIVLGLEEGGICQGCIFELNITEFENWKNREGINAGVYLLKSIKKDGLKITIDGKPMKEDCYVVVSNKDSPSYIGKWSIEKKAKQAVISSNAGGGKMGSSVDYIISTYNSFKKIGINDSALEEMYKEIKKLI